MPQKKKGSKKVKKLANTLQSFTIQEPSHEAVPSVNSSVTPQETAPLTVPHDVIELAKKWPKVRMKVPPIFLHEISISPKITGALLAEGIQIKITNRYNQFVKIKFCTMADHKAAMIYLDKNKLSYHTFGNPAKQKMKVVVRGLPPGIDLKLLRQDLKLHDVPVCRIHEMQTTKGLNRPLLLLIVVPNDDEGKKIFHVNKICGHNVTLEPLLKKAQQCHRCQMWGHAQRYCRGKAKCVKCAEEHLTKKCPRELSSEESLRCANCAGEHSANYRQCAYCPESREYKASLALKLQTALLKGEGGKQRTGLVFIQ